MKLFLKLNGERMPLKCRYWKTEWIPEPLRKDGRKRLWIIFHNRETDPLLPEQEALGYDVIEHR